MRDVVENEIRLLEGSVWALYDQREIGYSEGRGTEKYLNKVLQSATDLSSDSYELSKWVRDWPTDYHLSRRRANLLRGFRFDRSKAVLEIGSGCGAITRFLGETFASVTAIEGTLARARLARLRTHDLNSVSLLAAPFQNVRFKVRFDIVFCIGVLEYSGTYVRVADPYDHVISWVADALKDDGVAVIAIENQFGLKYFCSSREDHTGRMFDGLEGYARSSGKVRTFGYDELKERVAKSFGHVRFYFPYPDYKLPYCVLAEELFGRVKAGELVGKFLSGDRTGSLRPLFDERLVLMELDNNHKLPFFSNSFLVVAGKKTITSVDFPSLGVIYSSDRVREFQTVTHLVAHDDEGVWVTKQPVEAIGTRARGILNLRACQSRWMHGESLQTTLLKRCKRRDLDLSGLFDPCKEWIESIKSASFQKGGQLLVPGACLDWIFSNAYMSDGRCEAVDRELEWNDDLPLGVLVVRAMYYFLLEATSLSDINPRLRWSTRRIIRRAATSLGITLNRDDFSGFAKLEARLGHIVFGSSLTLGWINAQLFLFHPVALKTTRRMKRFLVKLKNIPRRIGNRLTRARN